ncbi:MAG: tRNA epoxyqueuosine(34) reductase QueG [Peptococcaceae bacterium]|jgi:epoxyqueuosine reductase|nr:tRNA epoxyqueuosine(34) reductase QueG [Peptococcaceae bacterium]
MNELTPEEGREWQAKIRQWAAALGFIRCGFTSAQRDPAVEDFLARRQERGYITPFEETRLEVRTDPKKTWSHSRSVFVLAYPLPLSAPPRAGEGVLARSAVGKDYHVLIEEKFRALNERLSEEGWPSRQPFWQIDTGPLNERALAVKAGVGWIGKNQQLIVPGYGSFCNLALLLFDQDFPSDAPLEDHCGDCAACVGACPARLLGEEFFNSRKCLSYLTQSKEVLTDEERERMGGRIFGCDTCQEACPHNQWRLLAEPQAAAYRRGIALDSLIHLSKSEFRERFAGTAAGWRGKGILQRNAAIGLLNLQKKEPDED